MPKITCTTLKKSSTLEKNENILDAFEKIKTELPSGCRSGTCGVCVVEIVEGGAALTPANQIEINTLNRLYPEQIKAKTPLRLACRAQLNEKKSCEIIIKSNLVNL